MKRHSTQSYSRLSHKSSPNAVLALWIRNSNDLISVVGTAAKTGSQNKFSGEVSLFHLSSIVSAAASKGHQE